MKRIFFVALVLVSCTSERTPFCKCMEAGRELNDFSAGIWDKEISEMDEEKIKTLRASKDSLCADYKTMGKEEMLSLQKSCEGSDELISE
ncbi:MAG: hypothetical protein MK066_05305 [Crocinitomicaceae bacterium]|nr:hypothetical protein [Crocinitomicaceae bacterium]